MTTRGPRLLVERREGVAVLTLSDPARRNAQTPGLSDDLAAAVAQCERDEAIGALVVTGHSRVCAGGDLGALAAAGKSGNAHDLRRLYEGFLAVARGSLPTVAAVNGPAVGPGSTWCWPATCASPGPRPDSTPASSPSASIPAAPPATPATTPLGTSARTTWW